MGKGKTSNLLFRRLFFAISPHYFPDANTKRELAALGGFKNITEGEEDAKISKTGPWRLVKFNTKRLFYLIV